MLDVNAVGADLTPAEQEETLADLAFFMDEFGSARAVRVKLQEQESDTKRLERQVWQLLNRRRDDSHNEAEEKHTNSGENAPTRGIENAAEGVDRTMADLNFFLKTYGSTRTVREMLESQKLEILGLQRTIQWLQERQSTANESESESNVEFLGTEPVLTIAGRRLEVVESQRLSKVEKNEDTISMDDTDHADDGNENTGTSYVIMEGEAADGVEMTSSEQEIRSFVQEPVSHRSAGSEDKLVENIDGVRKEVSKMVAAWPEREGCHADEECGDPCLRSASVASSADKEIEGRDVATLGCEYTTKLCVGGAVKNVDADNNIRGQVQRDQVLSKDLPMIVGQTTTVGYRSPVLDNSAAASSIRAKPKCLCSVSGCSKWPQVHGLCYTHGGYNVCKIGGCNRKAATRLLCRQHHGGKRCSVIDCEKATTSGGHCYRHAREHVEMKGKCRVGGCYRLREGQQYCHTHSNKDTVVGCNDTCVRASSLQAESFEQRGDVSCQQLRSFSQPRSSSSMITRRGPHVTCKTTGCLKWVKRNGDTNEHCVNHRGDSALSMLEGSSEAFPSKPVTSSIYLGGGVAGNPVYTVVQKDRSRVGRLCKEPGCTNIDINGGAKKGYCFRHGGGYHCCVEGCYKARQRQGLCASHGGVYECKVEECKKRVAVRGCCVKHYRKCIASGKM